MGQESNSADAAAVATAHEPPRTGRSRLFGGTSNIVSQFARYLVVGGFAAVIDFASLYSLTEFAGLHYLASAAIAFLLGLAANYLLSRTWVFDQRRIANSTMEFVVFAAIGVVGLGLNEAIMWVAQEKVHLHYMIGKAISAAMVLLWNFGARRVLLFSGSATDEFLGRVRSTSVLRRLTSASVALACLTLCLAVQALSGAWSNGFFSYPDEPAHFIASVMVRDWLISGRWFQPLEFARTYYEHYPYFAIGYWPPLFSVMSGTVMLAAGVGRTQALMIPAAFTAGAAWLVFSLLRRRIHVALAASAALAFLSIPTVRDWTCAVMVDNVTACLCIASAVCLIRYLESTTLSNAILCGVVYACAILTKYSAAYLLVLPVCAVVLARRFDLLKRPNFYAHIVLPVLIVLPWAVWTRTLAFYALPSKPEPLSLTRVWSFFLNTLLVFPPVLLVMVALGIAWLAVRRTAWRQDLTVVAILFVAHLAFLIVSPVDSEKRYLVAPAAMLLVMAFAGLGEALSLISHSQPRAAGVFSLLAIGVALSSFAYGARVPKENVNVKELVASVVKDSARTNQSILVPSSAEGPVIAEFVAQSERRPNHYLVRPRKALAHMDWFGQGYTTDIRTPEQMMQYFREHPVNLILWLDRPDTALQPHDRILRELVTLYPEYWHKTISPQTATTQTHWAVYEYTPRM